MSKIYKAITDIPDYKTATKIQAPNHKISNLKVNF